MSKKLIKKAHFFFDFATRKKIGVKDSKDLKDPTIRSLSKEIVKLNIPYSLLVLRNEKYNKLQKQGWS